MSVNHFAYGFGKITVRKIGFVHWTEHKMGVEKPVIETVGARWKDYPNQLGTGKLRARRKSGLKSFD